MSKYCELRGINGEDIWDFKINIKPHTWNVSKNGIINKWVESFMMSTTIDEPPKIEISVYKTNELGEPIFEGVDIVKETITLCPITEKFTFINSLKEWLENGPNANNN